MADAVSADTVSAPLEPTVATTHEVTPGGGIITRTDGSPTPTDWRATLPPELQAEKSLESFKDVGALAKGFVDTKRLVGNAVRVPGEGAKPEEWAEFHKKLGVPASPEQYPAMPDLPDGAAWQPEQVASFRSAAHQAGLTPKQVQHLVGWYTQFTLQQQDRDRGDSARSAQEERATAIKALEQRWGPYNGPIWLHHQARAEQAIRTLMGDAAPAAVQRIVESANEPEVADAFALLADSLLERGFLGPDEVPASLGADAAMQKANEIRDAAIKDPKHPLNDPHHPEHERVLRQYLDYHAVAAGPDGRRVVAEVMR